MQSKSPEELLFKTGKTSHLYLIKVRHDKLTKEKSFTAAKSL